MNLITRKSRWKLNKNGCWVWQLSTVRGYAATTTGLQTRVKRYVHRILFQLKYGQIPVGMDLDHLCRNRRCVNPDHLEVVSRAENLRRGANTVLNMEQVVEIRRRIKRASGRGKRDGNARQLASEFGISLSHVHNIVANRDWR